MSGAPRLPRGAAPILGCSCGEPGAFLIAVPRPGLLAGHRPIIACARCRDEACGRGRDGQEIGPLRDRAGRRADAFPSLAGEAARVGWPRRHVGDLRHDLAALRRDWVDVVFGWVLREGGTHLVSLDHPEGAAGVARAFAPEPCRAYFWDGVALSELDDCDALAARLADARSARDAVRAFAEGRR